MIENIVGTLELVLILLILTFALRILAIGTVLVLTLLHPERRSYYMDLFNIRKRDL